MDSRGQIVNGDSLPLNLVRLGSGKQNPEPLLSLAESASTAPEVIRYRLKPLVLAAWAAVTAAAFLGGKSVFDAMSMDDHMRLVEVRDFLNGQGWFDLQQYRVAPPAGIAMHWSRLVDLPIAGLILLLSPLIGQQSAEAAAATFWPVLLFLPALALSAWIAKRLAGEMAALATVLLVAVSIPSLVHFRPGALDHHGIQIVLVLIACVGTMPNQSRWVSIGGGLAAAASLAIGLEMLPALAALLMATGLRWALEGKDASREVSGFGLAFGGGAAILFSLTVHPSQWTAPVCDQISAAWVSVAVLAGGGLALLASLSSRLHGIWQRMIAGAAVSGTALIAVVLAFPNCLGDPYADLDPRMVTLWLAHVSEAQNAADIFRKMPEEFLAIYLPSLAGLLLGAVAIWRMELRQRIVWLAPMLLLLAFLAIAAWQVRGAAAANLLASAIVAASIFKLAGGTKLGAKTILALFAFSSPALVLAGQAIGAGLHIANPARLTVYQDGPGACRRVADFAPLNRVEPGIVVSFVDNGPAILAITQHSILAAPYHRNGEANKAAFDILLGDDAAVQRAINANKVRYVAICPGGPERINYERAAPQGLVARLSNGEVPAYLEAVPGEASEPMKVFRVRR